MKLKLEIGNIVSSKHEAVPPSYCVNVLDKTQAHFFQQSQIQFQLLKLRSHIFAAAPISKFQNGPFNIAGQETAEGKHCNGTR